ncbi:unnamed protein product [Prorocentrum cordatum]|uniref:Secreted protein n=1 Tax=Prorocentrum cordatum TaxID=2364126 RepID=A0ABN9W760_9DINO|nr:unnamed protein product [Polarella glacialis]
MPSLSPSSRPCLTSRSSWLCCVAPCRFLGRGCAEDGALAQQFTSPSHSAKASPPRNRPSKPTNRRHSTSTQPAFSARLATARDIRREREHVRRGLLFARSSPREPEKLIN